MSAKILDGESLAKRLVVQLAPRVAAVTGERGTAPLLAIVSIGGNGAAALYLRKKLDACREAGIETSVQALPASVSEAEALKVIGDLARNSDVDGIILDTPLPRQLSLARLLDAVPPAKDVEGVTPGSFGRLFSCKSLAELDASGALIPPTPHAILRLLAETRAPKLDAAETRRALEEAGRGAEAVVVGRSTIVGRPAAHLLSCAGATVTLCHSGTKNLKAHLKRADVVVTAVGSPGLVKGPDLKPGAVVLDAGIGYEGKKVRGDVDDESAKIVAGFLAPVPGGVGPVTVAMLLANIVTTAERRLKR